MASFGTDGSNLGIAFRTRSSKVISSMQNSAADFGAGRGALMRHHSVTTGPQPAAARESIPASQLPGPQLPQAPSLPSVAALNAAEADATASIASIAAVNAALAASALTPSQRGELELAKARADRAAAGRTRQSQPHAAAPVVGSGGGKRQRGGGPGGGDVSLPNSDDDDGGDNSDGELELSKLSPEEQERLLSARLANGGTSDKDARRLKRLLRNRVSAQQARERKKQYVTSLEDQLREQQSHIGLLEKRLEAVEAQNEALRNIIQTMRGFSDPPAAAAAAGGGGAAAAPVLGGGSGRVPGPGLGLAHGRAAGRAGASQQPQQQQHLAPAQVVPELPPNQHQLSHPGQDHQHQRPTPATRHSRAQLVAGQEVGPGLGAGEGRPPRAPQLPGPQGTHQHQHPHGGVQALAVSLGQGSGQGSAQQVAGDGASGLGMGFARPGPGPGGHLEPLQGGALHYPHLPAAQGQMHRDRQFVLRPGIPPEMSYGDDMGEAGVVPPAMEVPDCVTGF